MEENKVFVGNLPFSTTEDTLREEFTKYGDVQSVRLITDRETGRSRGFAFVTFGDATALNAAIQDDGMELEGRPLRINKAEERKPR